MKRDELNLVPRLSEEIDFSVLNSTEYILSNSHHKHYLKINKETHELLSLVDGQRDLTEICETYNSKFGRNTSERDIETLLYKKLVGFGILQGFDDKIKEYKKPDYLMLSFIIINEKVLSRIVKYFHFLFNKWVAIFSILLSILIIASLLTSNIDLYKSFNLHESMILLFVVMGLSVTFHEIGHATAASYFGSRHGGIGGGFYLFTPVYYADVTDIWKLSKGKRIIVNIAGMYFELIFCCILAALAHLIGNYVLLIITLIVCLHTLYNLNPFLRSDGYWIISDLTSKPNLYHHSFSKIRDLLRTIIGKRVKWTLVDLLLLLYGLVSISFIGLFLYFVLIANPNSILLFPQNLYKFVINIFTSSSEFTLQKYGELIVPFIFYWLVFRLLKSGVQRLSKKKETA